MSLQSERLLTHMLRLRLSYLPGCYEASPKRPPRKICPIWISWNKHWKRRARPSTAGMCA